MSETYFAHINEKNIVIGVHAVTQDFIDANPDRYLGLWVETFIDVEGKTYAGIGYTYDPELNDFVAPAMPPQPAPVEP
jgi:hypothetical protein